MTARQQLARLLPLGLLVVLAIAGLRGAIDAPRWNGPLRAEGVAVGLALEVVLGTLLVIVIRRNNAEMRAAARRPYTGAEEEIGVPAALRFVLRWLLAAAMVAIGVVLISNLHLHFLIKARPLRLKLPVHTARPPLQGGGGHGSAPVHIPVGPILYALLVLALIAAVVISIWWSARLRRAAPAGRIDGAIAEDAAGLREAVESGRTALAEVDDARAAIIACYVAMEGSLAERGTARLMADTPDELLSRATASGIVRGGAARRLTALFYEARFSSHPLGASQRAAASQALDELAAELNAGAAL